MRFWRAARQRGCNPDSAAAIAATATAVVLFPRDIDTPVTGCGADAGPGTRTYAGGALIVTR
jgi:hypothetical protein